MSDWIDIRKDPAHVARERQRGRELRASAWWRAQLERGKCHYCGGSFSPADLTMDHVVPVARGGRSTKGNVVPSCAACNASKRCITPAERILGELDGIMDGQPGGGSGSGDDLPAPSLSQEKKPNDASFANRTPVQGF